MTASEIRASVRRRQPPEVVSLAGGMPNLSALPLDVVGKLMGELVQTRGRRRCSTAPAGRPVLRELICTVMALEGVDGLARGRRRHRRQPAGARPGDPRLHRPR
jgi:DNA-binding transcriptional MocR family regulator